MASEEFIFDSVETAVAALKLGELLVVMDDETRENEGDLIMAAEFATPEKVAFIIRHTSGILCVPMTAPRAKHLDLPPMLINNTDPKQTAFTVSCDVAGTTTGVSAYDRTLTTTALADPAASPDMFRKPGHMFPLVARPGGVLERRGHTEANVDLCKLAGVTPVGLLAEIQNKDGTMARLPQCYALAKKHGLKITTVDALANYRKAQLGNTKADAATPVHNPSMLSGVELLAECEVPIARDGKDLGMWTLQCYKDSDGLTRHAVLIKGSPTQWKTDLKDDYVYTRIHSECFTSHVLGSQRCDCSKQLDLSLELINKHGSGVAIYVDGHEGRGIGLHNKIKAYALQHRKSLDTYQANQELGLPIDSRKYDTPKAILKHLGISKIALLTNNPLKVRAFDDMTSCTVPIICKPNEYNFAYLHSKRLFEMEHSKETPMRSGPAVADTNKPLSTISDTQATSNGVLSTFQKEVPIELPSLDSISNLRIGLIRTCWNDSLVGSLTEKCKQALLSSGIVADNIITDVYDVPGAYELPFAAQRLATSGKVDAIVCFGVLIKGETMHFEYISSAVATGLMQVQLATNIPVLYGVLNCLTLEQAQMRSGPDSPLPLSLATTAIRMASLNVETCKTVPNLSATRVALSVPMLPPCSQG
jgi:3,4-dihydroxy 2-butanone 4-phosphate synthase/GTP cyclohydrolase II